jgi:hypothetical protein
MRHSTTPLTFIAFDVLSRANRRDHTSPSDSDIERGLRERAVTDPRAAEILLRWLQRPRPVDEMPGVDLDSMSEAQLEALYAGLARVAALSPNELQVLVQSLLAGKEEASARAVSRSRSPTRGHDVDGAAPRELGILALSVVAALELVGAGRV